MITQFNGKYDFLSNFYFSRIIERQIRGNVVIWETVEHAFQAAKAIDLKSVKEKTDRNS